jgi:hypothetical protein
VWACGGVRAKDTAPKANAHPYARNLIFVNADQIESVHRELGEEFYSNRHNIANWAWELENFPDRWVDAFTPY